MLQFVLLLVVISIGASNAGPGWLTKRNGYSVTDITCHACQLYICVQQRPYTEI